LSIGFPDAAAKAGEHEHDGIELVYAALSFGQVG